MSDSAVQDRSSVFIDGAWVEPHGTETVVLTDPATSERLASVALGDEVDAQLAVAAASRAQPAWAARGAQERIELIQRIRELLEADRDDLAETITREVGTPPAISKAVQVGLPINVTRSFEQIAAETASAEPARIGSSLVRRAPVGVVAAITPWNYPLHQVIAKIVPALLAGCTVVLKPSELAPLTSLRLADYAERVGLPAGVLNVVPGRGTTVGRALTAHPDVDMVSFTGSTAAGRDVAAAAAATIKRVSLELGGKSASVLLPDADLPVAVRKSLQQGFLNSGQTCTAWTRMIVPRELQADVEALCREFVPAIETRLGPLISETQWQRVQDYIDLGESEGARLVVGGPGKPEGRETGLYTRATVFADVAPTMRIATEEIFGPVVVIQAYDSVDEAVALANSTVYGLAGGVWGADLEQAVDVASRLQTGQVDVNGAGFNHLAPMGGFKQSGVGRELGEHGYAEYFELSSIQLPETGQ